MHFRVCSRFVYTSWVSMLGPSDVRCGDVRRRRDGVGRVCEKEEEFRDQGHCYPTGNTAVSHDLPAYANLLLLLQVVLKETV